MKVKKTFKALAVSILTGGASLITGLLSVGGILALTPSLPIAWVSLVLAVAYEGQIYKENIASSLKKLLSYFYFKQQIARSLLLEHFPNDTQANDVPLFLKDYYKQLQLLHHFEHKNLDSTSLILQKKIRATLKDMENFFTEQLFSEEGDDSNLTPYELELKRWLTERETIGNLKNQAKRRLLQLERAFFWVKLFMLLVSVFMSLSTTYLLMEAFASIPFLAAVPVTLLPVLIVPMALIAGIAYGLMTYNAISDFISNDTINKRFNKIFNHFRNEGFTLKNAALAIITLGLSLLTIALTLCTAGTWWTIASKTPPLFNWMRRLPVFVMGLINPIVTGLAQLVFNLENTNETLSLMDAEESLITRITAKLNTIHQTIVELYHRENWLQFINPFRLIRVLTFNPLRIILFLGHAFSMAVTANRFPKVSPEISVALGSVGEISVDLPYFIDLEHEEHQNILQEHLSPEAEHNHSHDQDLPTQLLYALFTPIHALATGWDWLASQLNPIGGQITLLTDLPTDLSTYRNQLIYTSSNYELYFIQSDLTALAIKDHDDYLNTIYTYQQNNPNAIRIPISDRKDIDSLLNYLPPQRQTLLETWDKQRGISKQEHVELPCSDEACTSGSCKPITFCSTISSSPTDRLPSETWRKTQAMQRIQLEENRLQTAWFDQALAQEKKTTLGNLRKDIKDSRENMLVSTIIRSHQNKQNVTEIYNRNRLFNVSQTHTSAFIQEKLMDRISIPNRTL